MNQVVKIALAGISGYGDLYLESLLHDPRGVGVQLVGVVDPMPNRCRRLSELRDLNIPLHPNLQTLFSRSQVDLMMIVTPIHLHAPQTCFALQQGGQRALRNADASTEVLFYTTHAIPERKGPVMRAEKIHPARVEYLMKPVTRQHLLNRRPAVVSAHFAKECFHLARGRSANLEAGIASDTLGGGRTFIWQARNDGGFHVDDRIAANRWPCNS